jgi:hypothetical protein
MVLHTPAWVERMKPRRWYAISGEAPDLGLDATLPGTRYLSETDPARSEKLNPPRTWKERIRRKMGLDPTSPWRGTTGFSAITEAWNGAVYASRCGASGSMIVFGGGHDDYFGASVHAFDLDTREWRRVADGYVAGSASDYGAGAYYAAAVYPDGSPLPPHTYGYVQYDPVGNDYLLLKGQTELGPAVQAAAVPHLFNLDTGRWRHGPRHPTAILNSGGTSTWDGARRVQWGHSGDEGGGNAFVGFYPDGDNRDGTFGRWGECYTSKLTGNANHNAMRIDPIHDTIVAVVHAQNELYGIDPARPERPAARLESVGSKPVLRPYAALEHAPNLSALVYFSPEDEGTIYAISRANESRSTDKFSGVWRWEAVVPSSDTANPIAAAAARSRYPVNRSHVFGRFRVASFGIVDIGILLRHIDSPVFALRL